ncbi:unnamed protein product [Phytomonas sp. EM1]|nr:unnamed protein product [Phytomonas sp. EM1]|eukprot:CCW65859.1 unnamed protein product [Phytomonas sp. isolate EM1]
MALSAGWGQPVVVRISGDAGGEFIEHPILNNSSARALAAAGNPITIRVRDPSNFADVLHSTGRGSTTSYESGSDIRRALSAALFGRDISETFWIPDPGRNEMGLLEALHRRGATNRTYLLLQSRPLAELQMNYSTCTGRNIDLSHDMFRLSKTAMAVYHIDQRLNAGDEEKLASFVNCGDAQGVHPQGGYFEGNDKDYGGRSPNFDRGSSSYGAKPVSSGGGYISMPAHGFKAAVRASLQYLQEEDYYLVRYRDYSSWAVNEYRSLARSDSVLGKKYVEQCFAVHVGREPGELIPITEAQFLFGVDLLQRQLLNRLTTLPAGGDGSCRNYFAHHHDLDYSALNADQFRSLGVLLGDGMREVGVEGEERKRAVEAERIRTAEAESRRRNSEYDAPAWYDWSPTAVRRRVQYRLSLYYTSIGRFVVQTMIVCGCGYVVFYYARGYLSLAAPTFRGEHERRYNDRQRRGRYSYYYDGGGGEDDVTGYVRRGFFRSVLMGPKEVFDYFLAPSS